VAAVNCVWCAQDVLILRQFMRDDGTVYPRQLTGICRKQQRIVERCVMQAHWSGLFPKNRPIAFEQPDPKLDRFLRAIFAELKRLFCSDTTRIRLNRHWRSSTDIIPSNYDIYPGSSMYIKRFERADKISKWKADNEKKTVINSSVHK
jgi:ribosomal protein S18